MGKFVWHSFDFPTDTLLVGQNLGPHGPNMLVSGEKYGTDGYTKRRCRFLLEQNPYFSLVMHRLPNDNSLEPLIYFRDGVVLDSKNVTLQGVTFYSEPNTQGAHSFTLGLALPAKLKSNNTVHSATMGWRRPNTTALIPFSVLNPTEISTSTLITNTTRRI